MNSALNFWTWKGTVGRAQYVLTGLAMVLLKFNLDRVIARAFFQKKWSLANYLVPGVSGNIANIGGDANFYAVMVLTALPFIAIGVMMTLRRLRAAAFPSWMVALFFIPVINLIFFAVLSVLPSQGLDQNDSGESGEPPAPEKPWLNLDSIVPHSQLGSAFAGLICTVVLGTIATFISVNVLGDYGWGLFIGLPFCLGLCSTLIYGYHEERTFGSCMLVSLLAVAVPGAALLIFAFEGAICLLMAAPLAIPLSLFGGIIGHHLQKGYHDARPQTSRMISGIFLALPGFMGAEHLSATPPPLLSVSSSVEIDAPPQRVWKHVVEFSELPLPDEWLFKLGLAYPKRAEIQGRGVGAIRRCVFSTGPFVEPITVWDEPRLLKFSVTENPAPMQEWTFYDEIHPPHLHNFLKSDGGQFALMELPNGRTRLEGTTWYRHSMWPANYWQMWSDFIIHRIHLRVLNHVKNLAEAQNPGGTTP